MGNGDKTALMAIAIWAIQNKLEEVSEHMDLAYHELERLQECAENEYGVLEQESADEYVLMPNQDVWLTVGKFSVKVFQQDGSMRISAFFVGQENGRPIDTIDISPEGMSVDEDDDGEDDVDVGFNTYLLLDGSLTSSTYREGEYKCKSCGSGEVSYNSNVSDARCQMCGAWQNPAPVRKIFISGMKKDGTKFVDLPCIIGVNSGISENVFHYFDEHEAIIGDHEEFVVTSFSDSEGDYSVIEEKKFFAVTERQYESLTDGNISLSFSDRKEGINGAYDPHNPDDEAFLRLDAKVGDEPFTVLTYVARYTSIVSQRRFLALVMVYFKDAIAKDLPLPELLNEISWMTDEWDGDIPNFERPEKLAEVLTAFRHF